MAVSVVDVSGKDAAAAQSVLEHAVSEILGRGDVIHGIAPILGGNTLLIVSSAAAAGSPGVSQELESLSKLHDANVLTINEFEDAKKALLAKLST